MTLTDLTKWASQTARTWMLAQEMMPIPICKMAWLIHSLCLLWLARLLSVPLWRMMCPSCLVHWPTLLLWRLQLPPFVRRSMLWALPANCCRCARRSRPSIL